MSSEDTPKSDYPDWFQKWLDEFMQAAGMEDMPEYKAAYYPDWYKQAYPLMRTYGSNLWWTSALPSPIPIFLPSYAWSAAGRVASSQYYWAQGNRYVAPENLLGQASAAYYREQYAANPYLALYSASKALSYAAPGAGILRGFAFAPVGFAANAAVAYAEAPYIRQLVGAVGASAVYQALQGRGTAYPFQEPTAAEMYSATMEWTAGQTSFLLARSFASEIIGATMRGMFGQTTLDFVGNVISTTTGPVGAVGRAQQVGWNYLRADIFQSTLTDFTPVTTISQELGVSGRGGGILRAGWNAMGGWGGVASGVGFGLMQLGAQLTAQELSYVYAMGQAGLGGQLYATPERAQRGLERWGLAIGSWEAGVGLASYAGIMAGSVALAPALAGGGIALAGAAALGLQATADITARYEGNIPPNEPITYIRSHRMGGEFEVNPRLQGPPPGLGPNQMTAEEYKTWFINRGGVYASYAYMTQTYVRNPETARVSQQLGWMRGPTVQAGPGGWTAQWTETPDYRQAVSSEVAGYYAGRTAELYSLYGQRGVVGGAFRYSRASQVYSQLDVLYSKARSVGLTLQEQAMLSQLRVEAKVHHAAVESVWTQYSGLTDQINALRGFVPREWVETGLPNRIGPQLLNDQPLRYPELPYSGAPAAPISMMTPAGTYNRYGPQITGENIGYMPNASAVAWQAAVNAAASQFTITGLPYGAYNTALYGGTGKFGTLAEAQSYQMYLAGTDNLWLAQNTFRVTGGVGGYSVGIVRDIGTLGSESLANYARSQVQGTTRAEDLRLSLDWIDVQYKAGRIDTITYLNAKSNLQGYAAYTARAGEGVYSLTWNAETQSYEDVLTGWTAGSDPRSTVYAELRAGRTYAEVRADYVKAGMSEDLADYMAYRGHMWRPGGSAGRRRYSPWTLEERRTYFESTIAAQNYLYYPSTLAWQERVGLGSEYLTSQRGRYGVWRQGYGSSSEAWLYEKGAYAKYADAPSIEDLSSAVDANMIQDEVMWLAENSDLSNIIGAEFYRIGRETQ